MMRRTLLRLMALLSPWGDQTHADASAKALSAAAFWEAYFNDAFVSLTRDVDSWRGVVSSSGGAPGIRGMLRRRTEANVSIPRDDLLQYNDSLDPRFDLFAALALTTDQACQELIRGHYPFRSAPPLSPSQLGIVMSDLCRAALSQEPKGSELTVAAFARWLLAAVDQPGALTDQRVLVGAWFLGERRDTAGSSALLGLLERADHHLVSSGTSDMALSALWKIADAATLLPLCAQMKEASETSRWKRAKLFERLLSTDRMLGSRELGTSYPVPSTWFRLIEQEHLTEPARWKRRQAMALRWELRAWQARRLDKSDMELTLLLANDEVGAVRRAVRQLR